VDRKKVAGQRRNAKEKVNGGGNKAGLPNTACRGLRGYAGEKIRFGQMMESLEAG